MTRKDGSALIADERARQITQEGWTPEHDDGHSNGDLAVAAACYAAPGGQLRGEEIREQWPWENAWWKPTPNDRVRELVKAGALIAAEIDRLLRAGPCSSCEHAAALAVAQETLQRIIRTTQHPQAPLGPVLEAIADECRTALAAEPPEGRHG